jgi:Zn-dependent peptidase ImmA (M78 family)
LDVELPFKNKNVYKKALNFYRSILESRGIIVAQVTGISLEEMKGVSIYYDEFPIIAVNNKDYDRAKAFSLLHELAHLVRRSSSLCMIDFDDRNDEEEKICDKIAAEIMMPESVFISTANQYKSTYGEWSIECLTAIADKYAVSTISVIRRLYEIGKVSWKEYQNIYKMLMDDFTSKKEMIDSAKENSSLMIPYYARYLNREGYLYTKVIMSSYSKGTISYGEMCKTLNVGRAHIDKLERAVMFV